MRKYFKTTIIIGLVAMLGLASCSKSETTPGPSDEVYTVSVKILGDVLIDETKTRAPSDKVETDDLVSFNGGYLFLSTINGTITKKIEITTGDDPYSEGNGSVGIGALKLGATITNVNAMTKKAYFVANKEGVAGVANIAALKALPMALESQSDDKGGVKNVTLWGEGDVVEKAGDETKLEAAFDVAPLNSRLEIGKITASGEIASYKVEGIFVNNYYSEINLDHTFSNSLVDNQDNGDNYKGDAGSYVAALQKIIYDYSTAGIGYGDNLSLLPDDKAGNRVWGYNLLVGKSDVANAAAEATPNFVIRISDVVLNGETESGSFPGTYFLTISPKQNGEDLKIKAANVYNIPEIVFSESNLAPKPYQELLSLDVQVTMLKWTSHTIDYDL